MFLTLNDVFVEASVGLWVSGVRLGGVLHSLLCCARGRLLHRVRCDLCILLYLGHLAQVGLVEAVLSLWHNLNIVAPCGPRS